MTQITAETKFEIVGYKRMWVVVGLAPNYPRRFDNIEDAEAWGRKCKRPIRPTMEPVWKRVQNESR